MDFVRLFFTRNFILLCIAVVIMIVSIQRIDRHKRMSICMILITSIVVFLAIANIMEDFGKQKCIVPLATIFAFFGYILRPTILYIFILLSGVKFNKITRIISLVPLGICLIVYSLAFVPALKASIFFFEVNSEGTALAFGGGIFRYTSHIISLGYLLWLLYVSLAKLRAKHFAHSLAILVCASFVVAAVVIETFFNDEPFGSELNAYLLNATIAVSALQYYLFLSLEKTQVDSLTGLFNRESFYHDIKIMNGSINGVIQFDMNGLKYLNDNYGHAEGDKALQTISQFISKCAKSSMYAYRVGGDEFILIANNCEEVDLIETIENFTRRLKDTTYYCSVGYSYKGERNLSVDELLREAETKMYQSKNEFYKNSPFERRKV